jgi:hypothetical protein
MHARTIEPLLVFMDMNPQQTGHASTQFLMLFRMFIPWSRATGLRDQRVIATRRRFIARRSNRNGTDQAAWDRLSDLMKLVLGAERVEFSPRL